MKDYTQYDVDVEFTAADIEAVERVTGWGADDDGDMHHAIREMIVELAMLKGIDISDIDLEV